MPNNPSELRKRIIEVVSHTGGHLASSLGAVEIALALSKVFDPFKDRIVWDVGHQAYAWKILTGRDERFDTLRQLDGISGFPNPSESAADAAIAGHAGVAFSVAEGFAAARDRKGTGEHVVAVIGDSAMANGVSFEALNNCVAATGKVIVILNDNDMSISRPAGSFARVLGRLISGVRYNRVKTAAESAGHKLKLTFLRGLYHRIESHLKSLFLSNAYFEQFGLRYIGPVDGHDSAALEDAFTVAKEDKRSVIVHVVTKKGKGYRPAEDDPTRWHGVGPFVPNAAESKDSATSASEPTWSEVFGRELCACARKDSRIVALTAGMRDGTGLVDFAAEFGKRFFDVGIAEEHMVAFAAGLAAGGLKPVVAVYSTFLQRSIDQVMHDVCIANLPVVLCVDRAGIVGADGVTHQGIYDIAMLRCLPNLTICQPSSVADFHALLEEALVRKGPTVIRYPRGRVAKVQPFVHPTHPKAVIWATGDWMGKAEAVARRLGDVDVVQARYLKPFNLSLLNEQRVAGLKIISLENGCVMGGFGEAIGADVRFGWPDRFIPHGKPEELERRYGLDEESLVRSIGLALSKKPEKEGSVLNG